MSTAASAVEKVWQTREPGAWQLDAGHFPTPLTPYFAEILTQQFPLGFAEGSARIGLLLSHFDHEVVNGFDYIAPRVVGAPKAAKGPPPYPIFKLLTWFHPVLRKRLQTASTALARKPWREDLSYWQKEVRPRATATHLAFEDRDPAALDDAGLAQLLKELHENAHQQYRMHHRFTISAFLPVGDYIAHTKEWTGLSAGELLQACRQPHGVATDAREQFDAVVRALRDDEQARALLQAGTPAKLTLEALARAEGASAASLRAWLRMTGNRLVTGYDISDLRAIEMPELLVRTLSTALSRGDLRAADEERCKAQAERVRDKVPSAQRNAYDALLAEAISISNLREERALVLDFWAFGLVRRALKEAGGRIHARGRIGAVDHLFDATQPEILQLLLAMGGPAAAELAERYAWRTSVSAEIAPPRLGFPPAAPPPDSWLPANVQRMSRAVEASVEALFAEPEPRSEPKLVRGLNASAGTYEGAARVITRPDQFGNIAQGDVLVARITTEAYNGIIPLIGAVVTDRGGLLSHAATVAREFGIPAVVGTGLATKIIPDGARVRVDGDRGEARLL